MSMSEQVFRRISVGDCIIYVLPASQQPVDRQRRWHGRVEQLAYECVLVRILDAGYEGETEYVGRTEILSVTTNQPVN